MQAIKKISVVQLTYNWKARTIEETTIEALELSIFYGNEEHFAM